MKLKALVYQQKEWNPLQLSTDFPVFPVENITEEALAVWKLHAEEVLLITPTDAGIQAAVRAHMAVAAYADPAFPEQSYAGAWMVIEGFEEVDDEFLERIFQRCHGQPWEIARTKRCVIRELSLEDLPALEKLYQKEGVCRQNTVFLQRRCEEAQRAGGLYLHRARLRHQHGFRYDCGHCG